MFHLVAYVNNADIPLSSRTLDPLLGAWEQLLQLWSTLLLYSLCYIMWQAFPPPFSVVCSLSLSLSRLANTNSNHNRYLIFPPYNIHYLLVLICSKLFGTLNTLVTMSRIH